MNEQLTIILAVVLGIIAVSIWVVPILKKKNIDVEKLASKTETVLNAIEPVVAIAQDIPVLGGGAKLIELFRQYALSGAKAAEQLGKNGSLTTNEEKFSAAQQTVYAALTELKITPTENQKKLIDDFIQEAVNDLPSKTK